MQKSPARSGGHPPAILIVGENPLGNSRRRRRRAAAKGSSFFPREKVKVRDPERLAKTPVLFHHFGGLLSFTCASFVRPAPRGPRICA